MKRIESVDAFRLLGAIAVIAIHENPFYGSEESTSFNPVVLVDQFCRFAVPFFFVTSGYFWGKKVAHEVDVVRASLKMAKRIAVIFIVWSLIYLISYNVGSICKLGLRAGIKANFRHLLPLVHDPVRLLTEGTKIHLWFLASIVLCILISACFVTKNWIYPLLGFSTLLYLIGLLSKAYADTPLGISIGFNTRNGPFFGLLLFVSGYLLSKKDPTPRWLWKGAAILVIGYVLHFCEIWFLHKEFQTSLKQDFVVGTYLVGFGFALVALSNLTIPGYGKSGEIGRLSLGVYAIQFIFIDLLKAFKAVSPIGCFLAVVALSMISVRLLYRNKMLRHIIV
jgi:surface polysaccharide O-acyltransferase-like enzyme